MIETFDRCPKCKGFLNIRGNCRGKRYRQEYYCPWCKVVVKDEDVIDAPSPLRVEEING